MTLLNSTHHHSTRSITRTHHIAPLPNATQHHSALRTSLSTTHTTHTTTHTTTTTQHHSHAHAMYDQPVMRYLKSDIQHNPTSVNQSRNHNQSVILAHARHPLTRSQIHALTLSLAHYTEQVRVPELATRASRGSGLSNLEACHTQFTHSVHTSYHRHAHHLA